MMPMWLLRECFARNYSLCQILSPNLTIRSKDSRIGARRHRRITCQFTDSNVDAQIVGRIVTDVTSLKDRGLLEIVEPEMDDDGELCGNRHYKVEYDLVPMIKGRDLIYEARWPSSDSLSRTENDRRKRQRLEKYEFKQTAQISIAAAFLPGTG